MDGIATLTTKKSSATRKAADRITARDFQRPGSGTAMAGAGVADDGPGAGGTFISSPCQLNPGANEIAHSTLTPVKLSPGFPLLDNPQNFHAPASGDVRGDGSAPRFCRGTGESDHSGLRHANSGPVQFRPVRCGSREWAVIPVRRRPGSGASRGSGRGEVRDWRARCDKADPAFFYAPAFGSHVGLPGRDAYALGGRTPPAARGLRTDRHARDDGQPQTGLCRGYQGAQRGTGKTECGRPGGKRSRNPGARACISG